MSGALAAAAGAMAAASFSYSIGIANNGGAPGVFGYDSNEVTNPGSIGPVGTLKGAAITGIRSSSSSEDLLVRITGTLTQSFFRTIVVQDTGGVWTPINTSGATFLTSAGVSTWRWGSGSFPYFTAITPSPRGIVIFI